MRGLRTAPARTGRYAGIFLDAHSRNLLKKNSRFVMVMTVI
jgi:hypothetical protein